MIRLLIVLVVATLAAAGPARALEPVPVGASVPVIDLKPEAEMHLDQEESLQVSTAPSVDGVVERIEVRATQSDTRHWAVIGLRNPGDEQLDRLLVAPHYRLVDSGVLDPDLGAERVAAITPSEGFPPQRVQSADADVFAITLDPGATVTYVLELTTPELPQIRLWETSAYRDSQNAYTLYKGIIVGISGLLAVFFLVVFVIKGTTMFASAAVLAWVAFGYVLIDFAFFGDVLSQRLSNEATLRAFAEAMLVLTLAAFVASYLNFTRWRVRNRYALFTFVPLAVAAGWLAQFNPDLTAAIARVSLVVVTAAGLVAIIIAALRGNERAVMILPTWLLLVAWMIGAGLTVTGEINNDFVQPALDGGLILLVLLIGFTVMQHAFAGTSIAPSLAKSVERDVLALAGSGDIVWDWDVSRDRIVCGQEAEIRLGLERGELQGPPQDWFTVLHPQDRDRFRASLDATVEQRRGRINDLFRFRGVDGHFRWFRLRARPVIGSTGEIIRCVGTLNDATEAKTIEERLLHDSVYDNLTGLPNRHLFLDRIEMARAWSNEQTAQRLFVVVVNPDNFTEINDTYGQSVGDSMLLTMARRLGRILKRHDSVARLSGDSFGLLVYNDPAKLEEFVTRVREALGVPIQFADEQISVVVSLGIAGIDLKAESASEILDNAELALRRAKRQGGDRGEVFDPLMRRLNMSGRSLARDLKRAITEDKVKLQFRPIRDLTNDRTVGYEAMPSWHHPLQGPLSWPELLEVAAHEGMAVQLALATLERCAKIVAEWRTVRRDLTLLLTLPSADAFRTELVGDVKTAVARNRLDAGALQIGVPEGVVSDNPEFAAQLTHRLRDVGASPWIVDFARRSTALPHLHRLALDGVRFDEGLTAAGEGARRHKLTSALFGLATALEARVMVGGIMDIKQANDLHALGARYAVGAAFGRPVTAQGVASLAVEHAQAAE
ncbi:EAL domain-containing protein [Acuticoccus mangrovi]|uniref:EAL domain-containing protein n=1 Tax=Acuticoccus mangrovi TaxID=2796142 RepID=A0A934IPJ1_9HYPH|nr:EAL domain-containing protein [Acuticoccus mangrovi]MBJ3775695.1 EAL domain-containing protein [Acuticoccus mangrovi]